MEHRAILHASLGECGLMKLLDHWANVLGKGRIETAETLLSRAANGRVTVTCEGSAIIADVPLKLVKQYEPKGMTPAQILYECFKAGQPALCLVSENS